MRWCVIPLLIGAVAGIPAAMVQHAYNMPTAGVLWVVFIAHAAGYVTGLMVRSFQR